MDPPTRLSRVTALLPQNFNRQGTQIAAPQIVEELLLGLDEALNGMYEVEGSLPIEGDESWPRAHVRAGIARALVLSKVISAGGGFRVKKGSVSIGGGHAVEYPLGFLLVRSANLMEWIHVLVMEEVKATSSIEGIQNVIERVDGPAAELFALLSLLLNCVIEIVNKNRDSRSAFLCFLPETIVFIDGMRLDAHPWITAAKMCILPQLGGLLSSLISIYQESLSRADRQQRCKGGSTLLTVALQLCNVSSELHSKEETMKVEFDLGRWSSLRALVSPLKDCRKLRENVLITKLSLLKLCNLSLADDTDRQRIEMEVIAVMRVAMARLPYREEEYILTVAARICQVVLAAPRSFNATAAAPLASRIPYLLKAFSLRRETREILVQLGASVQRGLSAVVTRGMGPYGILPLEARRQIWDFSGVEEWSKRPLTNILQRESEESNDSTSDSSSHQPRKKRKKKEEKQIRSKSESSDSEDLIAYDIVTNEAEEDISSLGFSPAIEPEIQSISDDSGHEYIW